MLAKYLFEENNNVCFGEGGAGTFSDGKLNTLVKDKEFIGKKVFEILYNDVYSNTKNAPTIQPYLYLKKNYL